MKKLLSALLATSMLFLVSACNIKDVTRMAYTDTDSVGRGEFNFYLQQGKSAAISAAKSGGGDTLSATSTEEEWNTVKIGDVTAAEYARDKAKEYAKSSLVMKAKAIADGITLTDEDRDSIAKQKTQIIEQYGGRYNYEQYFTEGGFTLQDVEKILEAEAYAQKVSEKYFGDGTEANPGEITVSDEDVKNFYESEYVYVKHILVSNQADAAASDETKVESGDAADENADKSADSSADASADTSAEDKDAAALQKAKDLIAELQGGADFDKLMKENTADKNAETGEINSPEGYVFTKGEMVSEFETAAFALKDNELTAEPVKTSYGYHIIKRLPLPQSGELYDTAIENAKSKKLSNLAEEYTDKWAEELGFKFNDKAISKIKLAAKKA